MKAYDTEKLTYEKDHEFYGHKLHILFQVM